MSERIDISSDNNLLQIPKGSDKRKDLDNLLSIINYHINFGKKIVVVQGLGFVGAAVSAVIANAKDEYGKSRFLVIGVDLPNENSYWKITSINSGKSPIISPDKSLETYIRHSVLDTRNLIATYHEEVYQYADYIVVDIPLDVTLSCNNNDTKDINIDLKSFQDSIRCIGKNMSPSALVIIETTVPIGTCEKIIYPLLKEEREKRGITSPIFLAHSYERVMPGPHYVDSIQKFWRVYSGIDKRSKNKALNFLSTFIDTEHFPLMELDDCNSSELGKLLENSYRAVNIAFIYEWTLLAEEMGINLFLVIDAIKKRVGTHDNIRLPGFGVGGYCLTKDALLAQWSSNQWLNGKIILKSSLKGIEINKKMPLHVLDLLDLFPDSCIKEKTVLICGISYIPNVADTRNSPSEILYNELVKRRCIPLIHDPCVEKWNEKPDVIIFKDLSSVLLRADYVIFAVAHSEYSDFLKNLVLDLNKKLNIVDANNIISDDDAKELFDRGCRLIGVGKGHWRKKGYHM